MDLKKVLYISQEITPYLKENEMSLIGRMLPQDIQAKGYEVRTFMPRYGSINERRNQLHEVIRLSGQNIPIDDADHPLIIKVATLQPTRMQVYFIDNDDYFQRHASELEIVTFPEDNDERIMFFVSGVAETVKKLRWNPEIIHCSGWVSALAPLYLKKLYASEPAMMDSKVVFSIFKDSFPGTLDPRFKEKLVMEGIAGEDLASLPDGKALDCEALYRLGIDYADAIVEGGEGVSPSLIEYAEKSGKPFLRFPGENYIDACNEFYRSL